MVIKVKGHQNLTNSWGIITQIHTKLHTSVSDQQFFSYCTDTWTPIQIDVAKTILCFAGKQSNNNNNLYISNDCRVLCLTTPVIYGLGIVAVAGSYGAG